MDEKNAMMFGRFILLLAWGWAGVAQAAGFSCKSKADGNYPNPADCGSYIACSNGVAWVMPCPDGLYFNPRAGVPGLWQCDVPKEVECPSVPH